MVFGVVHSEGNYFLCLRSNNLVVLKSYLRNAFIHCINIENIELTLHTQAIQYSTTTPHTIFSLTMKTIFKMLADTFESS